MHLSRTNAVVACAIAAIFPCLPAQAQASTWVGPSDVYSDSANWDTPWVPCLEIVGLPVAATIDAGVIATQDIANCTVPSLTLGVDDQLSLMPGTQFTADSGLIAGALYGQGGHFNGVDVETGGSVQIVALNASSIALNTPILNITQPPGVNLPPYPTVTAFGSGSEVILPATMTIDASFDSGAGGPSGRRIRSNDGAQVDLSGVTTILGPQGGNDVLLIDLATGGSMLLDSLESISGGGIIELNVGPDSILDLPSLGSLVSTALVTEENGEITANSSEFVYAFNIRENHDAVIIHASDQSTMDLTGAIALDLSFDSTSPARQTHWILVGDEARVDLSGVETILGAVDSEDFVNVFSVGNSILDLSSLATVDGGGQTSFSVHDASTLYLPSLVALTSASFTAYDFASIVANETSYTFRKDSWLPLGTGVANTRSNGHIDLSGATQLDLSFDGDLGSVQFATISAEHNGIVDFSNVEHIEGPVDDEDYLRIAVDNTAQILFDSLASIHAEANVIAEATQNGTLSFPSLESSQGLTFKVETAGAIHVVGPPLAYEHTSRPDDSTILMLATGEGSLLSLPALTSLDSGFNSSLATPQVNSIEAHDGGVVDLRNLSTVVLPFDTEDTLLFSVSAGRMILGPMDEVSGGGIGLIDVGPNGAALEFPTSLKLSDRISLTAGASADIAVRGDFSFRHTDEADIGLESAILSVTGAGLVAIEVGGENLGAAGPLAGNFGIGQLVVGSGSQTVSARLVDAVDNGNGASCAATGDDREALYLYGLDSGTQQDGLRVLNGSTLDLGGLDAYVAIGGVLTHLNPLVVPGVPFPYDEGFIEVNAILDVDLDGIADGSDNCVLRANPDQTDTDSDGFGNACDGDLNNDMIVNGLDLGQLKLAFFSAPASPNWNPNADFNGDLQVNAVDLGLLKLWFFLPPGPACPVP